MNTHLLKQIFAAKEERRKQLSALPIEEKIVIIEKLRDLGVALREARAGLSQRKLG